MKLFRASFRLVILHVFTVEINTDVIASTPSTMVNANRIPELSCLRRKLKLQPGAKPDVLNHTISFSLHFHDTLSVYLTYIVKHHKEKFLRSSRAPLCACIA